MPLNRLHTLTRWPEDELKRKELAEVDLDFCVALGKVLWPEMNPPMIPRALWHTKLKAREILAQLEARN